MNIILLIIILAILVLSHELGHFLIAKLWRIRVDEFGFGLPPRAWGKKVGDTIYSLNWIPFGGFVRIFGEEGDTGEGSFAMKPKLAQASVIVAGVIFNILLAFVLLWFGLQTGLPVSVSDFPTHGNELKNQQVIITYVLPDSPAEIATVPAGARLLKFKTPEEVSIYVRDHVNESINLVTDKGTYTLVPNPILGIEMDLIGEAHLSPTSAIIGATKITYRVTQSTAIGMFTFISNILKGHGSLDGVVGPVGIAGIIGEASEQGFHAILLITVILSLSLAVINLVPFPALDGGRLLFVVIEAIKGSPISKNITTVFNMTGFAILILLMLVITYQD